MANLIIEYRVQDFAGWKRVFDQDPIGREAHGATGHWIYQDPGDPNHLMLSIEFPSVDEARRFLNEPALQQVWEVSGAGQSWVLEKVEAKSY